MGGLHGAGRKTVNATYKTVKATHKTDKAHIRQSVGLTSSTFLVALHSKTSVLVYRGRAEVN